MSAIEITQSNFQEEVLHAGKPVLLDFWARWCSPCRMVGPIVDEVAAQCPDVKVGKVNIEQQPELAKRFQIASIPTLLVLQNGQVIRQASGAMAKGEILAMLEPVRGSR